MQGSNCFRSNQRRQSKLNVTDGGASSVDGVEAPEQGEDNDRLPNGA